MQTIELLDIIFTDNENETVIIKKDILQGLIDSNNEAVNDIKLAVNKITSLLKALDIINKNSGEFQKPSMGRISSFITSAVMGNSGFEDLIELKPMLLKYKDLI